MLVLITIGLLAGAVTSISPCILPVLPVVLAAGTNRIATPLPVSDRPQRTRPQRTRHRRGWHRRTTRSLRPYGVVAGLVLGFSGSTLLGSLVLDGLGLPQDLLRNMGVVVLAVVGLGMVSRRVGELVERPFARLTGRTVDPDRNGLVVGLGAGLLFVPCAGPVLATIAVVGATHRVGAGAVVLTLAFGVGVGLPLLAMVLAGDAIATRTRALRTRAHALRVACGLTLILCAAALGLNLTDGLQQLVPGYTVALQRTVESNDAASRQLEVLTSNPAAAPGQTTAPGRTTVPSQTGPSATADPGPVQDALCQEGGQKLANCGPAPELAGITGWLNTPDGRAIDLASLRGKVVLIDFWTYSCINCQRTLPHVEAWHETYADAGLVVIGVHTPEFAFEHLPGNVAAQAAALGVGYPVAIDNTYATWDAFHNQYWPSEYLIDASGVVRHYHFGEGQYDTTERLIRQLLTAARPGAALPTATHVADTRSPTFYQTPETYLGYAYPQSISGTVPARDRFRTYAFPPALEPDSWALSGSWKAGAESLTAGSQGARLQLSFRADNVYVVLGGTGSVLTEVDGVASIIQVTGPPTLHLVAHRSTDTRTTLTLTLDAGVQAYDVTFG